MTPQEIQIVTKAYQHLGKLNEWERGFVSNLHDNLDTKRRFALSEKQATSLHNIDERLFEAGVRSGQKFFTTASGKMIDFRNPTPESISIWDIAHGLTHTFRFNGQTRVGYTVAAHSMRVAELAPEKAKLQGLLHDATEAYMGDINSPLKVDLPDYRRIESRLWRAIAKRFNVSEDLAPIKAADDQAFEEEAATIHDHLPGLARHAVELNFDKPEKQMEQFMTMFYRYGGRE